MGNFFDLYDSIISEVRDESLIDYAASDDRWALIASGKSCGMAMMHMVDSKEKMFPEGMTGLSLKEAVKACKSWNFEEASFAVAAANCFFNTEDKIHKLGCFLPFEKHYAEDIDFAGKKVAIIGHLSGAIKHCAEAESVCVIERDPQSGDYPDSACDYILPQSDIVIITGSTIANKTLPHLLDLSRNAYTVLTGPSVPLFEGLFDFGIDRIAGMAVNDKESLKQLIEKNESSKPFNCGIPFVLSRS